MAKDQPPPKQKNLQDFFGTAKTKSNASETSPNGVEGTAVKSPLPSTSSNNQVPDTKCTKIATKSISAKPNSFVAPQKSNDAAAARSLERGMAEMGKTETGTSKMTGTSPDNNKKRKSEEMPVDNGKIFFCV